MPHQFMSINCSKCGCYYCPVCHEKCPQCGEIDIADEKTMQNREQMRLHTKNNRNNVILEEKEEIHEALHKCEKCGGYTGWGREKDLVSPDPDTGYRTKDGMGYIQSHCFCIIKKMYPE